MKCRTKNSEIGNKTDKYFLKQQFLEVSNKSKTAKSLKGDITQHHIDT